MGDDGKEPGYVEPYPRPDRPDPNLDPTEPPPPQPLPPDDDHASEPDEDG